MYPVCKYVIVATFLVVHSAFSQETKLVEDIKENHVDLSREVERYYVLTSNYSVKHGSYLKFNLIFGGFMKVLVNGNYKNGVADGQWEHFFSESANGLQSKGSYVNGKKNGMWTFYYADTLNSNPDLTIGARFDDSVSVVMPQAGPLLMAGMYLNDKRVGKWTALDLAGKPFQIYDFTKRVLIQDRFIGVDSSRLNVERPPIFIGGIHAFHSQVIEAKLKNLLESVSNKNIRGDSASVTISLTVAIDGTVKNVRVKEDHKAPKRFTEVALETSRLTDGNWLPAIRKSQPVEAETEINFIVKDKFVRRPNMYHSEKHYWVRASIKGHFDKKQKPGKKPGS